VAPAVRHARRAFPAALAALGAALGATMLPFWPPGLAAAIAVAAGVASWVSPRLGLAIALAAPVFPLGNVAEGAAILYGVLALAWLALAWRDARWGLLPVTGPLLAGVGLLALAPLAMQPARGWARRAVYGAAAVLSAAFSAGLAREELPATQAVPAPLDVTPVSSAPEIARSLWEALLAHPEVLVAAVVVGAASALLPWARHRSPYGFALVGFAMLLGATIAGASIASMLGVVLVWGLAAMALAVHRIAAIADSTV
jgi:hypothetical protein